MKVFDYKPSGVCSTNFHIEIDDNEIVQKIKITRGCAGNSQGVARLCEGMPVKEVIKRLKGIDCGGKGTSCPDQLAKALSEV